MPETHRFIIDRHEGDLAVVEVDGGSLLDVPRWLLPHAARADDVLGVTVDAGPERTVVTIVRDAEASARARAEAEDAVARLKRRDPGGDLRLWRRPSRTACWEGATNPTSPRPSPIISPKRATRA